MKTTGSSSNAWQPTRRWVRSFRALAVCGRYAGVMTAAARAAVSAWSTTTSTQHSQCRMLLIYRKGVKDDLTAAEKKTLRKLNENW